jgi:hypothetical protein
MYPFMARTAHADPSGVSIIEHNTPVKSRLDFWQHRYMPDVTPSLITGTGIQAAFNIITSNCELRHGLSAFAKSKEEGHNSMLQFCRTIQQMESGDIGAGVVEIRRVKSARYECFYDELDRAGALEGNDMNDRWGFENTSLPQFKYGYTTPVTVSDYLPGDQYSQLGTTLRACVLQPAPFKGPRRPSYDERA